MTAARLKAIKDIFLQAREVEPQARSAFLEKNCGEDEQLRREIELLLDSDQGAADFLAAPPAELASELLSSGETGRSVIGSAIGHYHVIERLGAGGMGEVYLAEDIRSGRKAALKLLPPRFAGDRQRFERFQREARTVIALNHPNILTIYEIGEEDGTHYIVSELIEGETLRQRVNRGRLKIAEAVEVASEIASALVAAHKAGIVHRDIKPENVMLRADGYVKVLDFGIAKLAEPERGASARPADSPSLMQTTFGSTMGTLRYMSPEQARGDPVDHQTDVWSLGVVLYEMVTGVAPFAGNTSGEVMTSILETDPPPLKTHLGRVPVELQQIVNRTLHKDRTERFPGANEMLDALRGLRRKLEFSAQLERSPASRWWRSPAAVALGLCGAILLLVLPFYRLKNSSSSVPEKSIAVLPFENLSRDPDNAFFTDGIQDEILTALARIADLKVISRTSVMEYKSGTARDLREIGQQLGVGHLLEGSVQRLANRVRVNAQLVDAHTDARLWAQTYDADLADVFTVQSDIAKAIAGQLQAKLSLREQTALGQPLTTDFTAFLLYSRAKSLIASISFSTGIPQKFLQAVDLLDQAVARDPSFFLAYCQLAYSHAHLYFMGHDHTPARLALAEAAIQAAFRLRPDAGEAHLARGENLFWCHLDYAGALAELDIARRSLPNDPGILQLQGRIQRRQGKWEEALPNLERALELDPRNLYTLHQIALTYALLRRYPEEAAILDRGLALKPNDAETRLARAQLEFDWKADPHPLRQMIDSIRSENPAALASFADSWLTYALADRDVKEAETALEALGENAFFVVDSVQLSRNIGEALVARMMKDEARARAAFTAARLEQEKRLQTQPDFGPAISILGLIDAGLGRKEEALREGRRAMELLPVEKDSINGTQLIQYFAIIAAWTGETDLACEHLAAAVRLPGFLSYGQLQLLPFWDPLRGEPCFEKIVSSLAPK